MKVMLISSIVPGDRGGGRLVLRRHLQSGIGVDWKIICDGPVPGFSHVVVPHRPGSRIFRRLSRIRGCNGLGNDGQEIFLPCDPGKVTELGREYGPDVILTVAHGGLARLASEVAKALNLPLVTIFHDWWPDLSGAHECIKPWLDRRFRALHQSSAASLCVCEGMLAALGPRPGAEVLYPMAKGYLNKPASFSSNGGNDKLRVCYSGNLGDYGGMLRSALEVTLDCPSIRIEARGDASSWPESFKADVQARGLWRGFQPMEQLDDWMASAHAFLVAMRFEPPMRRFMETSFPSKLVTYAQFHRPIVIWGPEYCSAVRWARTKESALCVIDPKPAALVRALETLRDPAEREKWAAKALEAANGDFNPDRIQAQFLSALERAAKCQPTPTN